MINHTTTLYLYSIVKKAAYTRSNVYQDILNRILRWHFDKFKQKFKSIYENPAKKPGPQLENAQC